VEFSRSSDRLKKLVLNNISLHVSNLRPLLEAIHLNPYLKRLNLDLSENGLGFDGAVELANNSGFLHRSVEILNLSSNDFGDEGLMLLFSAFRGLTLLEELLIDKNFKHKSLKQRNALVTELVRFAEKSRVRKLSMTGGHKREDRVLSIAGKSALQLREDILAFLYALSENRHMKELDISGHRFGNKGAFVLARLIHTNHTLEVLRWDENGTEIEGFKRMLISLKMNSTLISIPVPLIDVRAALENASNENAAVLLTVIGEMQSFCSTKEEGDFFSLGLFFPSNKSLSMTSARKKKSSRKEKKSGGIPRVLSSPALEGLLKKEEDSTSSETKLVTARGKGERVKSPRKRTSKGEGLGGAYYPDTTSGVTRMTMSSSSSAQKRKKLLTSTSSSGKSRGTSLFDNK